MNKKIWIIATLLLLFGGMLTSADTLQSGDVQIKPDVESNYKLSSDDNQRATEAFANLYHYQAQICNQDGENCIANPITKDEFMQQKVQDYINEVTTAYEIKKAREEVPTPKKIQFKE